MGTIVPIHKREAAMAAMPEWFLWTNSAELGQAVLVAREAAGWTQSELAKRAGVTRKFLYALEHGKDSLRVDKVMQVLAALSLMPLIVPAELAGMLR
jgi:HTH-type transcriptional regulator/antitoxin HipB